VELVDVLESDICPVLKGSPNEKKCQEYYAKMVLGVLKLHKGIHTNGPSHFGKTNKPYRDSSTEQILAIGKGGDKGTHCTIRF
jgi:hypothetical protein